ncbi:MAG: type II toxin-antitoxin system VapC family toxin [Chloroflexota bacterium]|nr:type II toxin-antitoxin system VapC family toxin [Chloroflexota bacterium]
MTTYVDASVLLAVVLGEPGAMADWPSLTPISSELIRVECLRVIDRAHISQRLSDEASARYRGDILEALSSFRLVSVSSAILQRAADPFPTALGSLDAIHLATALELRDDITGLALATHDRELAIAAGAVGFVVTGV